MRPASTSAFAAFACLVALYPSALMAQDAKNQGYLLDPNGNVVTSSTTGLCVRTSDWTPARAAAAAACSQCTPDLCPKPAAAPAPAPAPAAKPAPKPDTKPQPKPADKPAPAKLLPQKISFSADALFDFDKADLRADGRAMLDDLARVLQGAVYEVILAVGHADRIGSTSYNQRLSVRRAESVKRYLVSKGIEPNRIHVEGKGESQPLTKPGDCRAKNRKALIACLQPDRRVDVEVTGTKAGK
jgi:OOP family OmpA-OmpF porin